MHEVKLQKRSKDIGSSGFATVWANALQRLLATPRPML